MQKVCHLDVIFDFGKNDYVCFFWQFVFFLDHGCITTDYARHPLIRFLLGVWPLDYRLVLSCCNWGMPWMDGRVNNTTSSGSDHHENGQAEEIQFPPVWPLDFRITATVLHAVIFVLGVVGNVLVVIVVYRKKSMHIPTYCYLVS